MKQRLLKIFRRDSRENPDLPPRDRTAGDQPNVPTPQRGDGDPTPQGHRESSPAGTEGDNQGGFQDQGPQLQGITPKPTPDVGGQGAVEDRPTKPGVRRRAVDRILMRDTADEEFRSLNATLESISVPNDKHQKTVDVKILQSRIPVLEELLKKPTNDEKGKKDREELITNVRRIEGQLPQLRKGSAPLQFEDCNGLLEELQEALFRYMLVQQTAIYGQESKLMDAAEKSVPDTFRRAKGAEFLPDEHKGCLEGTRRVVLNAIELWANDPKRSQVYWLNGPAGTGKSAIAKTIAERLFANGQLGASFFCSRDSEDRRNLDLIFPTLAIQLARKHPKFRKILIALIKSDPEIANESLYNQMNKLIVQPLKKLDISTVIVIDALEECEDEAQTSAILSVLGLLVSEIPKVKFFLASRPEPRISERFRLPLLAKITDTFVLHGVQVDSDIRLFFRTRFLELARDRGGLDNWPGEQQLDHLCGRAAGLFAYAAATVEFVSDDKKDPIKQLGLVLESQKIGAHEGKTLDTMYTSILQEVFGNGDPDDDAKNRSVLGAVILAANPLTPSTIATLLGFDAQFVLSSLSSLNSLLILEEDARRPVQPFHKSFPDFVTDPSRCVNRRFYVSPPDHHVELLTRCLDLMNQKLAKNMCKLPDAVANSDVSDLKERIEEYIDPALQYACLSWHMHLVNAYTIPAYAPTITPTLRQFLENKFLFWLEVLSVLGAARNAVEALQAAAGWLEELPTLDLANDCFRFVTGYFEVINASAPHIYHSALAFAPQKSIVRARYGSHVRPLTRVVHGIPMSWDANLAVATRPSGIEVAVWSPCDRFIAITWDGAMTVDVLDSLTLQRLRTLEFPQERRALVFSPDSRILTCFGEGPSSREQFVVSWDLHTGAPRFIQRQGLAQEVVGTPSITYSANGKMVGVLCQYSPDDDTILIFDVASNIYVRSHSPTGVVVHSNGIWAHGESLRYATVDATAITIWEVGLASDVVPTEVEDGVPTVEDVAPTKAEDGVPTAEDVIPMKAEDGEPTKVEEVVPAKVKSLPIPEGWPRDWNKDKNQHYIEFLPALCRLAIVSEGKVMVWDTQDSKSLLPRTDATFNPRMSFSSDAHFFACSTTGSDVYIWQESPTGYTLHNILASGTVHSRPLFSPNGESIVVFCGSAIRLWRTGSFTNPPSGVLTRTRQLTTDFVLDFCPDGMLAAVARQEDNIVTVLKSGVAWLTIDTSMKVYGLRVIGNAIVVVGDQEVVTWNLPKGDRAPDAKVTLEDSARTIRLQDSPPNDVIRAPKCRIAFTTHPSPPHSLYIYDGGENKPTGEPLNSRTTPEHTPWFVPDGSDLWLVSDGGKGRVFGVDVVEQVPPEGYPWALSHDYQITDDWWILGPGEKRLLMLPPPWQSPAVVLRIWNGQFLALLHGALPLGPVILEVDV